MIALRQMWKLLCGLERELGLKLPFLWHAIPVKKGVIPRSHRPIEPEEFYRQLQCVNGTEGFFLARDAAILHTLYHGGLRVSELTALNISSVDPKDLSILTITRKRRDKLIYRRIYVPNEAMVAILTYLDIRQFYTGSDALFINLKDGKRLSVRSVERTVKKYSAKAGLDTTLFKPHCYRHGWGKRAAKLKMYPPHIKAQLGHTNLSGSEIYFNITNTALKEEVMEKMGNDLPLVESQFKYNPQVQEVMKV